jgi:hypothetical protein
MQRMLLTAGLSAIVCASISLAASTTKTVVHHTVPTRWQAQELKGTISMVDPQQDLVVVRDSSGTPFDLQVQRSTRILNGQSAVKLSQLSKNESVDVRFVPEARGDMARQIEVQR